MFGNRSRRAGKSLARRYKSALRARGTRPTQLRQGWLRVIGAPDYKAYLIHHAARHPGTPPMAEREYVNMFIERRFDGRSAGRCC